MYGAERPSHYRQLSFNGSYKNCNNEFCYEHRSGKYGFISEPPLIKKHYRIIAFGDSFMEGVGALSPDSAVPALLEKLLNKDSTVAEVFNFGCGGSDVVFQMKYILDSTTRFHPDLILMMYNNSDISDIIQWGDEERFLPDGTSRARSGPWFAWLYKHFRIVRLIIANGLRYDSELLLTADEYKREKEKAIQAVIRAAQKSAEHCRKHSCEFVMTLMPFGPEVTLQRESAAVFFSGLEKQLKVAGVKTINLFEPMATEINTKKETSFWWLQDGHYNRHGYELIARELADSIRIFLNH